MADRISAVRKFYKALLVLVFVALLAGNSIASAEPIYHETAYPDGEGAFPVVIALHTSGGFKTVKKQIRKYMDVGYAVYALIFLDDTGSQKATALRHGPPTGSRLKLN
jgi:dienelactone hydrolase